MASASEKTKAEYTPFELKLPELFDLKPEHVVDLPGGRKAEIYRVKVLPEFYNPRNDKVELIPADGWRVVIRTKRGSALTDRRGCYDNESTFNNNLALKLHLESLVKAFTPTKRTSTVAIDPDGEDE